MPEVLSILFARERSAFTHPVETYGHWALLGLQSGRFSCAVGLEGEQDLCDPGEFVLCPPEVPLRRQALGKISFYFIQFRWPGAVASDWAGKHALHDLVRMESTLSHLEKVRPHPAAGDESVWADHLVLDLLRQRRHERNTAEKTVERAPDRLMFQVAERMRKELSGSFSLDEVAGGLRLTPSQISRRFKAAFGTNPALYRTRLRMQESRRLLLETDWTLERIAEACGYENAFYFSRVFHAQNGQSPSRFRKSLRV